MDDEAMPFLNLIANTTLFTVVHLALVAAFYRHVMRDQGIAAIRLSAASSPARLLGNRPIRRLRSHLRRIKARIKDGRDSDTLC